LNLELAQADDKIDNATVPLLEGRKKVNLGMLRITSVSEDVGGASVTLTCNLMVLPKGVENRLPTR
jgi:catalase